MLLGIVLLLVLIWGFLETDLGQNWLAHQVTSRLSRELQTHISIKKVHIGFFDKLDLEGVYVQDQKKDTLLYAGHVNVRITDWFFFKDKAELKYIGLSNAIVSINRTDSVWNYHFIEKYFSSPDTQVKKSSGIHFDLKKVELNNFRFIKTDSWTGNNMTASVGSLDLDADTISLFKQKVRINHLNLTDPFLAILDYKGREPDDTSRQGATTPSPGNQDSWDVLVKRISLKNGGFRIDKKNLIPTTASFDDKHINFNQLTGTIDQFRVENDVIKGAIALTGRERSGLVIRSLKTHAAISSKSMVFDNLLLQTNKSTITNYFSMRFASLASLDTFEHAVKMEANFARSMVASDDIAFFAPELKSWKKVLKIDGRVKGTVDDIHSKDIELWAGNNTYFKGTVSLVGLPNINQTLFNLDAQDLRTTYADAAEFIPSLRSVTNPNLSKLTRLQFTGTYTGFITDFVLYGKLRSNLGDLVTDLNMNFPASGVPEYHGKVSTSGFQLGPFINSPQIGMVDFHGSVDGKGFRWEKVDMKLDGIIHHIQYGNYTYQNIKANGALSRKLFTGDLLMNDPNASLHVTGTVDLRGDKPVFKVDANIDSANLRALQITSEDIRLKGLFNLNMEGSNPLELTGTARISNATLLHNGKQLSFDSLYLSSTVTNGVKQIHIVSNELDANVAGKFDLKTLPKAFTLFLSRYYPTYIKAPQLSLDKANQDLTFDIKTGTVEEYVKLIDSRLTGFNNSHFSGALNTVKNTMTFTAQVPQFSFKKYEFYDIDINASGDLKQLSLTGQVSNAQIGDSLIFPQTNFTVKAQKDVSEISINTTANQAINKASIAAEVKTFSDGLTIRFNPSSFSLNGKNWSIEQGGELNFRKNTVVQGQVVLKESQQEVRLWTEPSSIGNWNDLHVSIQKLNLGDLSPLLFKKDRLEGLLSGNVVVEDAENKRNVTGVFQTDELRFDNDSIGRLDVKANYDNGTGLLTGNGANADPDHHIDFDLALNLKDSTQGYKDRISLRPTNFQLKTLELFIGDIFSDIQGFLTGNVDITGRGRGQALTAKARVHNAGFKLNFTQVYYTIDDTEIELKRDTIDFRGRNVRLRDRLGNTAVVDGFIAHKFFSNMLYDISIQTESRRMELINTTARDNSTFYGRAYGSATFNLVGPEDNMHMEINAQASNRDSSFLTLPPSKSRQTGEANFMLERKYGHEMNVSDLKGSTSNLDYDITVTANPHLNVDVILDELTGDVIKGRGNGTLEFQSGTNSPLTINGTYFIEEGSYNFTFQSFFKKPFILQKGTNSNNFIKWNGDPYGATIHLDAVYRAEKVSFAPLASSLITDPNMCGNSVNVATIRDDVDVIATLTGELFHPIFNFRLEFPSNNDIFRCPVFAFAMDQVQKNPTELNKQVTFLIVTNSFAPYENASNSSFNPLNEFAYNTISGLFFGEVNKRLNQLLGKILQNNNFTLNLTGSLYNRTAVTDLNTTAFKINQSDLNLSVGMPLLNGRAQFTVGGTFDVPINQDFNQIIRLFPDVMLKVALNKTGSLSATFFYRQNYDYLTGGNFTNFSTVKRYGASLSYGREFDNLGEFFSRKRKPRKVAVVPTAKDTLPVTKTESSGSN